MERLGIGFSLEGLFSCTAGVIEGEREGGGMEGGANVMEAGGTKGIVGSGGIELSTEGGDGSKPLLRLERRTVLIKWDAKFGDWLECVEG